MGRPSGECTNRRFGQDVWGILAPPDGGEDRTHENAEYPEPVRYPSLSFDIQGGIEGETIEPSALARKYDPNPEVQNKSQPEMVHKR